MSISEFSCLVFFLTSSFCTSLTWEVFCQADLIIIYVCFLPKMHLFRLLLGFHAVHKLKLTNRRALVWRIARKSKLYEDVIQVYGPKPPCSTSINFLNFKGNMALNFATHAQQDQVLLGLWEYCNTYRKLILTLFKVQKNVINGSEWQPQKKIKGQVTWDSCFSCVVVWSIVFVGKQCVFRETRWPHHTAEVRCCRFLKEQTKEGRSEGGAEKRCRKLKHTDSLSISHKFGWSFPSTIPESWLQVVLHAHCFPFYPQGLWSGFVDWYILQTLSSKILKLTTPLSWTRFAMERWRTSNFKAT